MYLFTAPREFNIVECTDCSITIEWFIGVPDVCLSYDLDHRPQGTYDWSTETFLSEDVLKEEDGRRMYTLQNLQPETYYEFKIRSVYKDDVKSHYSESTDKQTLKLAPKKFDIVECTDCSITVEWFVDVKDECLSYELDHQPQGTNDWSTEIFLSEDVLKEEDGRHKFKLKNLLPETYYGFKMRSVYENDVKSHYSESKTKQTLKLAPREFNVFECTDCSIIIEWLIDVPDDCLSYDLDHQPQGTDDWSTETFLSEEVLKKEDRRRMYTLQNLLPKTYYELKIRSVYKDDVKSHYSESKTKQTLKLAPKKFDIVECTDCSITIEWFVDVKDECLSYELDHRPQGKNDCSTETFLSEDVLKEEDGRRMYTLQNLQPETYYEFKMRSVYKDDVKSHYSESTDKQTLKLAPKKIDIVECTDCSITVEWFVDVKDECLSYELDHQPQGTNDWSTEIFLSEDVLKEEDGRHKFKLKNLLPETLYGFKMRSVYENDVKSHYSESKTKQTLKLANTLALFSYDFLNSKTQSIQIQFHLLFI
ncbi:COL12A [Mytilus coruscus]|uniref:COL12A n=1 Tax=Mytilus coruscus TaxID=42192 RepID=A0A6J8B7N3_MYTCO|nr:COL12A [Mytilus coruscus]